MKRFKTDALLTLGMALSADRRTLEQRLTAIFARKRSARFARFLAAGLAVSLSLACFTTACRPVREGAAEPAINEIQAAGAPAESPAGNPVDNPDAGGADFAATAAVQNVMALSDSFTTEDGKVDISVNASLALPDGPATTGTMLPKALSMDEVKRMALVLFDGAPVLKKTNTLSRAELQAEIEKTRAHIADEAALIEYYRGERETAMEVKAEFEARIRRYEAQLEDAPEDIGPEETDWAFHPRADYTDMAVSGPSENAGQEELDFIERYFYQSRVFEAKGTVDGYHAFVRSAQDGSGVDMMNSFEFTLGTALNGLNEPVHLGDSLPELPVLTLTVGEAQRLAVETVANMGLERLLLCPAETLVGRADTNGFRMLASSEDGSGAIKVYRFLFRPAQGGAPLLDSNWAGGSYPAFKREQLAVVIAADRVFQCHYFDPMESQIMREEPLLAPERIGELIRTGLSERYADRAGEVRANEVTFGSVCMRVSERDTAYALRPVIEVSGVTNIAGSEEESGFGWQHRLLRFDACTGESIPVNY